MLLLIFLALILLWVVSILPAAALTKQVGRDAQMGPRDDLPEPTSEVKRANKALSNLLETLPIFLTLAVLSIVYGEQGWLSLTGGVLYLLGRVAHPILYIRGIAPWRSYSYLLAMVGCLLVALPLLPKVWGG